jgi:hypothetical protein
VATHAAFTRHARRYGTRPCGRNCAPRAELLPHGTTFASLEEARLEVDYYLDTYFDLDRRHSALGCRSPHQFEYDFKTNLP